MAQEADRETHAFAVAEVPTREIQAVTRNILRDANIPNLIRRVLGAVNLYGLGRFHSTIAAGEPRHLAFGTIRLRRRGNNPPKLLEGVRGVPTHHLRRTRLF